MKEDHFCSNCAAESGFKMDTSLRLRMSRALSRGQFVRPLARCLLLSPRFMAWASSRKKATSVRLVVHSDDRLEIRLQEPLPIYPVLLTDHQLNCACCLRETNRNWTLPHCLAKR